MTKSEVDSLHSNLRQRTFAILSLGDTVVRTLNSQSSAAAFDDHSDQQLDLFTGILRLSTLAYFENSQMVFLLPGGILSHRPQ